MITTHSEEIHQSNGTILLMQVLSVQDGDAGDDGLIPNVDLSQLKSKDLDALAAVLQRWIQERLIKPSHRAR